MDQDLMAIPPWCPPTIVMWRWQDLLKQTSEPVLQLFREGEFQDPSSVRMLKLSQALAQELIDEHGLIDKKKLGNISEELGNLLCPLQATGSGEYLRLCHILHVLQWLQDPEICLEFEKIRRGSGLNGIDRLILLSLKAWPGCQNLSSAQLTDRLIRVSLLSAWMTYLRQAVGSCFATAPAILVLTQEPRLFLQDMQQLLSRGILTRTFEGKEFAVPAAEDAGLADLRKRMLFKPSLLRSPGLMWSFAQSGMFFPGKDLIHDLDTVAKTLISLVNEQRYNLGWVTPLLLIEAWTARHFSVSIEDLREYQRRPISHIPSGSLQIHIEGKSSHIEAASYAFNRAKEAFCLWTDHPILRMWEFTLASFSETRHDYCQWSLHTSLGMNYDQPGGLAQCLYQILQDKVSEYNTKTTSLQPDCDNMAYQVQHVMSRLQHANSDHELTWLRVEYQNVKAQMEQLQQEQASYHRKAQSFANLFNQLLDLYVNLFDRYFQQVYDPQMRGADVGPYDDAPAGFRLVFKAGRSQAATWTPIASSVQFIESLARFLIVTEQEMLQNEAVEVIHDDFSHIVTLLVQHVRSQEFLKSAFMRMAKGLSTPVDISSIDSMEKSPVTPWAYVSGGTMKALVSQYYGRSQLAQEKQSSFQDIRELWVFLIDIMRDMSENESRKFLEDHHRPMLMHSHTHAFLFLPGHPTFAPGWTTSMYPYTWIRDDYEVRVREIYSSCPLDNFAQQKLFELYAKYQAIDLKIPSTRSKRKVHEFRSLCLEALEKIEGLSTWRQSAALDDLDGLLLRSLPILDQETTLRRLEEFCQQSQILLRGERKNIAALWMEEIKAKGPCLMATEIVESFYSAYRRNLHQTDCYGVTPTPLDLRMELAHFGLGLPLPIFFADSNWDHYHLAFVLNPGSDELELWRLQPDSFQGFPMNEWKDQFQDLSNSKIWGVYSEPREYLPS